MNSIVLVTAFNGISDWALNSIVAYGVPVLLFLTFIGSLGIPFPVTLVIIGAGALARQGLVNPLLAAFACLVGAALADNSEYWLGHLARGRLERRFSRSNSWQQAMSSINKQGGWAIVLTRFWLTPLAPAVNFIAGSRFTYTRFLAYDVFGEFVWVLIYGGLGYVFVGQWMEVSQMMSNFTAISVGLVVAGVVFYILAHQVLKIMRRRKSALASVTPTNHGWLRTSRRWYITRASRNLKSSAPFNGYRRMTLPVKNRAATAERPSTRLDC